MRKAAKHLRLIRKESWMRVKDPNALRRKRLNRRYSQRDLAYLVRRSQNTIYLLESGKMKTLSEDLALLLAARLEVDWEDYFELEENEVAPVVTEKTEVAPVVTKGNEVAPVVTNASQRKPDSSAA